MEKNIRDLIIKRIQRRLSKDERISSIFLAGSMHTKQITEFSDIDLWILFPEESGINSFKEEVENIFSQFGILLGVYACTAHHFFIVYKNGIQIDLNLVTGAQFYSLRGDYPIEILFDRQLYLSDRFSFTEDMKRQQVRKLLLVGYSTLERALSKFAKENYFVVLRFLDSVRHHAIMPLLPFIECHTPSNAVSLEINRLSPELQTLFIDSYAKPTKESNKAAIFSILTILGIIAQQMSVKDFTSRHKKIERFLHNHT